MEVHFDTVNQLSGLLKQAATTVSQFTGDFDPQVRVADARFGDLQANGILPYAKRLGKNPRELADLLLAAVKKAEMIDEQSVKAELAGPGFINFSFTTAYRMQWLQAYANEADLRRETAKSSYSGRSIVVDFSSPNTAKRMHVGHIRSTVIGDVIARILSFSGAKVIRDNHIGDWGTQFGLLILGIKKSEFDLSSPCQDVVGELEGIYKRTNAEATDDEGVKEEARQELVKLQNGDPENCRLWKEISRLSLANFQESYQKLGVRFDETLGESFYCDKVKRVYDELVDDRIAKESEGALVVFHPEHKRFKEQAFIIRKSDGASNYATTDLATVLYRIQHFKADEIIYVTDSRQSDHFEQLFLTVKKWFAKREYALPQLKHVTFGTILGTDGKAIKTRSGEPVRLDQLLDEAIQRARTIVDEKNPDLPDDERQLIAERVGMAALRYADLTQNRTSNYTFSWEKMLSFEGNTGPYLLYAVARIHSIFRKVDLEPGCGEEAAVDFETEGEQKLARKLMHFPLAMQQAVDELFPHFLCNYLYELADTFSTFYSANHVVGEEPGIQSRRLLLCARTLFTLETGLRLLGIDPLERM